MRVLFCLLSWFFFFFKQKTAYEMRISDWSSYVCSSDLKPIAALHFGQGFRRGRRRYSGFFGEILDANPIGRGFHNCLNDTRALPLKDRAESTARFLGLRPINQHVGSGRRDEERAAEIEITDTLLLKDIPCTLRDRAGDQHGDSLASPVHLVEIVPQLPDLLARSEEHTSELQSL